MSEAFAKMRSNFVKWIQRPSRRFSGHDAPPTFLWVLENPENRGFFHAHWLVYVPPARQQEFAEKLDKWLRRVAKTYTPQPIHIEPVSALLGAVSYMLKGQFPTIARDHGIDPEYQGWIPGKKRSGCSENIGPTSHERLWRAGKHPRPTQYRIGKYPPRTRVM